MKGTIDIYERDHATRGLLQQWLSQAGYRVRERGGSGAPSISPVDLVILASQVPMPKALGLIRIMRAIYPTTAFLLLSDRSDAEPSSADAGTPTVVGATRVLSKPLTREALLRAVHAIL
jgi:DNA-binding response OmpR family regulator